MFADLHTHILFDIDDGPETIEASIALLQKAVTDGIDSIIATPHFYASMHSLDDRVELASKRFEALKNEIVKRNIPIRDFLLGYEVRYFKGISSTEEINKLCINGSKYLLLELGQIAITEDVIDDIMGLIYSGYTVILAHLERYTKMPGFKELKKTIFEHHIPVQVTAASFLEKPFQRAAFRLLKDGLVTFISTDMHNDINRGPMMTEAVREISKYDPQIAQRLIKNGIEFFEKIKA